jgi:glycosyltransferase involved in cell wall biosynthesis
MIMPAPKILRDLLARIGISSPNGEFDAEFYLSYYDDLKFLRTRKRALEHYVTNGAKEGRFPNEKSYLEHITKISPTLLEDFDDVAYKFFNKDLQHRFGSREEYLRHYVDHGSKEGRVYRFENGIESSDRIPLESKWQVAFSTSQFLLACSEDLENIPRTRAEALRVFMAEGIEKLWPISLDYAFDASFYRSQYRQMGAKISDAELYRSWLTSGFPSGEAPNERVFLSQYLGDWSFPRNFDWETYARSAGLPSGTTRARSIVNLFNASSKKIRKNIHLMGGDAGWLLYLIGRHALGQAEFEKASDVLIFSINIEASAERYCLLGDAYRQAGRANEALGAYERSQRFPCPPREAFLQAAAILVSRGDFERAFGSFRDSSALCQHLPEFSRAYEGAIDRYFEYQSAKAHKLYNSDLDEAGVSRAEADALLVGTLDEIKCLFMDLDNLPARTGGAAEGYVIVLANDDLPQCKHYRVQQRVFQFEAAGIPVQVFSHHDVQAFTENLVGARAAIFYRVGATPRIIRAILHANAIGLETFYEIDDLLFDASVYPDPFETFQSQITVQEYAGLRFGVPLFRYAMSMCRSSIASTPALADQMRAVAEFNRTLLIRNGLDDRNTSVISEGRFPDITKDGPIRIFYGSGTKAHNSDFNDFVGPALIEIMRLNQDIELVIVGHLSLTPELDEMRDRIIFIPFIPEVNVYWSLLATCDINIAVLRPGVVADCKSEIKWLEAGVLEIPSVVSPTATMKEVIDDGVDGFLAESPNDWRAVLERLIAMPDLRAAVGSAARRKALTEYSLSVAAEVLKDAFGSPQGATSGSLTTKTRVLVCNVFFHPQSFGGATRVVEANVRHFLDHCQDLEIGVFCSDERGEPPGRLMMGRFDGAPVYRLAVRTDPDRNHRAFDAENAEAFHRVLDHFRPDVIHFHSIQSLSASIVEAAASRNIPHVITLHDAWWISDHQFLVDSDGLLKLPTRDVLGDCVGKPQMALSVNRRRHLGAVLQNATQRISVSRAFAKVYNDAGIRDVDVVANGISDIDPGMPELRADGRVALGHVGGRSSHKGAFLIEAALRRGAFGNLHLTMVDGALLPGQSIETIWGTTPVTLIGPYPQSEVSRLYARLNVLLAPSTWPESFGLVAREALACGLWVVASRLGAMGEDITVGRNGFLVDVESTESLCEVLRSMDEDWDRFRRSPEKITIRSRTADDQAKDLRLLYLRLASRLASE